MTAGVSKVVNLRALRYLGASATALLVDYLAYCVLVSAAPLSLPAAAALSYGVGLVAAYVLIKRYVFPGGWLGRRRGAEAVLFALSGALGAAVTYAASALYVAVLGSDTHLAKLTAVAVSFVCVYLFRLAVVFRD